MTEAVEPWYAVKPDGCRVEDKRGTEIRMRDDPTRSYAFRWTDQLIRSPSYDDTYPHDEPPFYSATGITWQAFSERGNPLIDMGTPMWGIGPEALPVFESHVRAETNKAATLVEGWAPYQFYPQKAVGFIVYHGADEAPDIDPLNMEGINEATVRRIE